MNLTPLVLQRLIELHPFLADIPPDAPDGIDSPLPPAPPIEWSGAGHVLPIHREFEGENEGSEGDKGEEEGAESERSVCWSDWALRIGAGIMTELREEIWNRLHYTTSAGIAHNKAMAKVHLSSPPSIEVSDRQLCSSVRKPRGQTVLRHAAVEAFLKDTPFTNVASPRYLPCIQKLNRQIRNLGGKLGRAVADEFQAETVGELL